MLISKVLLKDFRNFEHLNIEVEPGLNIFYGDNAQGKTNLLESIYICSTGRSQRTRLDREMISIGCNEAHIQIYVRRDESSIANEKIDVHLKKEDKKGIAVNGLPIKNLGDLFGMLLTVVFSPEDLQLVKAGPAERRKYMDVELCQLSKVYYYHLQQYYKVLKQRNNLLKNIVKNKSLKETLPVWDEQLASHGNKIIGYRSEFMQKISGFAEMTHKQITKDQEKLTILYKPNTEAKDFRDKLVQSAERDLMWGSTSAGIHKDDLIFAINGKDVKIFGSQGQQRTACLSAKLAEIELIKEQTGKPPVLLLDDVLSELDESRQWHLMSSIGSLQTMLTCTGVEDGLKKISSKTPKNIKIACYKIEKGSVKERTL